MKASRFFIFESAGDTCHQISVAQDFQSLEKAFILINAEKHSFDFSSVSNGKRFMLFFDPADEL